MIGTPIDALETPVLLVDLDAMEHNIDVIARHYRDKPIRVRGHVKNHKSPAILARQIAAGGSVGGLCAAKVSEAEVFIGEGVDNVLVANQVVDPAKIGRLARMAGSVEVMVAVDAPAQVDLLAAGAQSAGVVFGVVIEIDTMMRRGGVRSTDLAVELARQVTGTGSLVFRGVMSHQVPTDGPPTREQRFAQGGAAIERVLAVKQSIEAVGIPVDVVSTGESWTYDVAATFPEVTEIEAGTYVLMEVPYAYMREFRLALRLMGRVVERPDDRTAVGDVPIDAIGAPNGHPSLAGMDGVAVTALDHHGVTLSSDARMPLEIGDHFFLLTHQQDITVNRWDRYLGVRGDVVETVFETPARGCVN